MPKLTKIVFFGTPEFAVPALEALVTAGYEIAAVITQPDRPVGRGLKMEAPPVKVKALELGLTVLQPLSLRDGATPLSDKLRADLGICVAYGAIIPKEVLDIFPRGILNIHPSLLPKYRGPSPIQAAILNGDDETGVTIMLLDAEMDHGSIINQQTIPISRITEKDAAASFSVAATGRALSEKLAKTGAELLMQILTKWLAGGIEPEPQDHEKATYTKLLTRDDGRIDWHKPAEYLERQVRAYDLWPGTFTMWAGKRLKILDTALLHPTIGCASNSTPGYVWKTDDNRLTINCNPGALVLTEVQLEGKKSMTGAEFVRGYPGFLKNTLL